MKDISRREAITRIATGTAGLGLVATSGEVVTASQTSTVDTLPARAFRGVHQPRPLPFDPAKLKGLSEKLIRSHWENNYGGAVKALNAGMRDPVRVSSIFNVSAKQLIAAAKKSGLEGIIAKRVDSSYESGERSGAWLKYKTNKGQELVIGGYKPGPVVFDYLH